MDDSSRQCLTLPDSMQAFSACRNIGYNDRIGVICVRYCDHVDFCAKKSWFLLHKTVIFEILGLNHKFYFWIFPSKMDDFGKMACALVLRYVWTFHKYKYSIVFKHSQIIFFPPSNHCALSRNVCECVRMCLINQKNQDYQKSEIKN